MKASHIVVLGVLALGLGGCALLSKGEVREVRYFSPDLPLAVSKVGDKRSGVELRLGRVSAGSYIGERIVYRQSDYEIGFYDDRRWTERPAEYLRRALARVLFEEEGLESIHTGAGPTLDVELVSFEEVLQPRHVALVRVAFSLRDQRLFRVQETIAFERPIAVKDEELAAEAVAEALGGSLRDAVYGVSRRVLADLSGEAPGAAP